MLTLNNIIVIRADLILIIRSFSNQEDSFLKNLLSILSSLFLTFQAKAQPANCKFKEPVVTINFGNGIIDDLNSRGIFSYDRVTRYCPSDGYYTYTSKTIDCFRGDWLTLDEDHTAGDANGNMMIVNASPFSGPFLMTPVNGLKGGTTYEFSVWMMNVCKPTDKCPFPLLPVITILLQRPDGKVVAEFTTNELVRMMEPQWSRYQVVFTTTPSENNLVLTMIDNNPGGCGNDFALDDISIRECVVIPPALTAKRKTPVVAKKSPPTPKKPAPKLELTIAVKKPAPKPAVDSPEKKQPPVVKNVKPSTPSPAEKPKPKAPFIVRSTKPEPPPATQVPPIEVVVPVDTIAAIKPRPVALPPPPPIVAARNNPLVKLIETETGEIKLDLYDNGEIDGDTISVYHNNKLVIDHARLTGKALSLRIKIDAAHPHHELIMVAHNLGSIPPNTSLMVVTAGGKRYEVFISSNEQKNGKVVIDLKE